MVAGDAYRTDDLVIASVLSSEGMCFMLEAAANGRTVIFIFPVEDEVDRHDMNAILDELVAGRYRVDPFSFAKELGSVRTRLYRFLEHHRGSTPSTDKRRLRQA